MKENTARNRHQTDKIIYRGLFELHLISFQVSILVSECEIHLSSKESLKKNFKTTQFLSLIV